MSGFRAWPILGLLASLPALAQPPAGPAAASASEAREATFETSHNLIFIEARINGSAPLSFILDSGASMLVVDSRRARALGLRQRRAGRINAVGGPIRLALADGLMLEAVGATLRNQRAGIIDLSALEPKFGRRIDGIVGGEFFRRHRVEIDYARRRVALRDLSGPAAEGGEAIPIAIEGNTPFATLSVTFGDGPPVTGRFLIDTGALAPIYLNPAFAARHRLPPAGTAVALDPFSAYPGGEIAVRTARAAEARLGPFTLRGPLVQLFGPTKEAGSYATMQDGLIGGELLRRFTVVFDYAGGRMFLKPNAAFDEGFEPGLSGLDLVRPPDTDALRIRKVLAGSPAERAGLRAGDRIIAMSGMDAAGLTLDRAEALLKKGGAIVKVSVLRGDVPLTVELRLPETPPI